MIRTPRTFHGQRKIATGQGIPRRHLLQGIAASVLGVPLLSATAVGAPVPDARLEIRFRVFRKDQEIGHHRVLVQSDGSGGMTVATNIKLQLKLAFITAFRFQHNCEEVWSDGVLIRLSSQTDDDGDKLQVSGAITQRGFELSGPGGPLVVPRGTLTSNSFWTPVALDQETLIDAQDGGLIGLTTKPLGNQVIEVAGSKIAARAFNVLTPFNSSQLWYDGNDVLVKAMLEIRGEQLEFRGDA